MRYAISGTASSEIQPLTSTAVTGGLINCLTGTATGALSSTFWLRGVALSQCSGGATAYNSFRFFDAIAGATSQDASTARLLLQGATATTITDTSAQIFNFSPPGIKFTTGVGVIMTTSIERLENRLHVWGYYE